MLLDQTFCLAVYKTKFCYLIPEDDCRDDMEATEATLGGRSSVTSPVSTFSVSAFPVSTFSKWFVGDTQGGVSAGTIQAEVSCNILEQYVLKFLIYELDFLLQLFRSYKDISE
jgi:hypothetical protein